MPWFSEPAPEWVASFIGGPYDGAEVVVIAVCEFVAVQRQRDPVRRGRSRLSVIGNPDPTPPDYALYRMEGFDDETVTYVYDDLNFIPPSDDAGAANRTRELEHA